MLSIYISYHNNHFIIQKKKKKNVQQETLQSDLQVCENFTYKSQIFQSSVSKVLSLSVILNTLLFLHRSRHTWHQQRPASSKCIIFSFACSSLVLFLLLLGLRDLLLPCSCILLMFLAAQGHNDYNSARTVEPYVSIDRLNVCRLPTRADYKQSVAA